jgi:hypothetical protein
MNIRDQNEITNKHMQYTTDLMRERNCIDRKKVEVLGDILVALGDK